MWEIKEFFMPIGGGNMQEINFWLAQPGWLLIGSPTVSPRGAAIWTLMGPVA